MARTEGDGTRDPGRPSSGPDHPIDVPPILAERHPDVPWRAFFRLYRDLPRAGPGTDACTRRALDLVGELGPGPSVYDLGCGPGRQTLVLARELGSKVVALDLVLHFLEELRAAAEAAGLGALVDPRLGDMAEPFAPPGSVDLIWAEGSIYLLGFEAGLRQWRELLRPGGHVAVSEATWLAAAPPAEVRAYWHEQMPTLTDVAGNLARAQAAGYEVRGHFALPREAWLEEYYSPLEARVERLADEASADEELAAVLAETRREIEVYRRWGDTYGYVFYVLRRT